MPSEFFFMGLGGLGISLAGFAGLIAALSPESLRGSAVVRWRISHIVVWALHLTFVGFGVVAIFAFTKDAELTARIASLTAAVLVGGRQWRSTRPGPHWPNEQQRQRMMIRASVITMLILVNAWLGSVAYLHLVMLLLLLAPSLIFVAAIRDVTAPPATE